MNPIFLMISIIVGLAAIWLLIAAYVTRRTHWVPHLSESRTIRTSDGWDLGLHHLQGPQDLQRSPPLVLCHGILMSRHCWLPPEDIPSLARSLARMGHDIWVVELRGSGASFAKNRKMQWTYDFADYIEIDLPAICAAVREASGADQVHWVGHSMGGMIAYAHLATTEQPAFQKLVTLGSPVWLGRAVNRLPASLVDVPLRIVGSIDLGRLARVGGPFLYLRNVMWNKQFLNPVGLSRTWLAAQKHWGVQRTATRMLRTVLAWQQQGGPWLPRYAHQDGPYPAPPGGILALHGAVDYMATPKNVGYLEDFFPDAIIEAAEQDPSARPYGHLDLLAGPPEVEALAERIHRFLTADA